MQVKRELSGIAKVKIKQKPQKTQICCIPVTWTVSRNGEEPASGLAAKGFHLGKTQVKGNMTSEEVAKKTGRISLAEILRW